MCEAIEYEIDSIDMPIAHYHYQTCRQENQKHTLHPRPKETGLYGASR
ncbi:MAG: hypothetical protein LUQ18_03070 [Methylococcaceae bacterium]|nr:hypothetical protein [Methylococcaceae bacterium]